MALCYFFCLCGDKLSGFPWEIATVGIILYFEASNQDNFLFGIKSFHRHKFSLKINPKTKLTPLEIELKLFFYKMIAFLIRIISDVIKADQSAKIYFLQSQSVISWKTNTRFSLYFNYFFYYDSDKDLHGLAKDPNLEITLLLHTSVIWGFFLNYLCSFWVFWGVVGFWVFCLFICFLFLSIQEICWIGKVFSLLWTRELVLIFPVY